MKLTILITGLLASTLAFAHGDEPRVAIELENSVVLQAGQQELHFQLVDTKLNQIITDQELNISHEKKLHVLIYDQSLNEFTHVHPDFINGEWRTTTQLSVNGKYFVWAQGEITSDGEEFSAPSNIEITKGTSAWPLPPQLSELRAGTNGNSKVELGTQKITANKMVMLGLKFTRTDGSTPNITPYLGAMAHIVATPTDGDSLVHVHPMNGSLPNEGMLHVTFPEAGIYRLWIQFIDGGNLKVIPLAVKVN